MALFRFEAIRDLIDLEGPVSKEGPAELSDFPQIALLMDSVQASIESFCGRVFELESYTETGFIDGLELYLPALPIKKIKSFEVDGVSVDISQLKITRSGVRIPNFALDAQWKLKYQGGFDDIPADIQRAALLQTVYEYNRLPNVGATSVSTDGGSTRTPELGLLQEVKNLLWKYRNYDILGV